METFIDLNPAALPPRKRLKSLGSSASPPSTPTTPPPPRPSSTSTSAPVRLEPLNQSALKRKIPEPDEKEERFTFSNQNVLPPRKAAMFNLRGDAPSPSPSDSEPEQPRRGRPGRKPGSSSKKPIKRQRKEDEPLYCLCRQPYDEEVFMIACDVCNDWFHGECVGMTERKAQSLKIYVCPPCTKSRAAGQRRRSVVKVREDVEVNVEDEDDDEEDQYEKENYHEYQQQRRKRAKGQPAAARGRTKGTMPGSTTTSAAARRRSIGANGIGGMRKSQSIIEDDTNHVVAGETDSSKEDVMPRRVCVNKDCNNAAKPQSKYCSTECGVRVATQFLEMQKAAAVAAAEPARTPSPKPSPKPCDVSLHSSSEENLVNFTLIKRSLENSPDISAADDSDLRQLESLERQRGEVEHNLRSLAAKREEFAKAVQFSTTLFAATAATHAGDDPARMEDQSADRGSQEGVEVMDCFSCGQPIPGRNFGRHIEQCYAKKEGISCPSPSLSAAPAVLSAHKLHSRTLDSGAVITYCNHFDARSGGGYCAHPLDSCPLHSDKRGSDERRLCGCPTGDFESGHCERLRSDCVKHFNWENIRKMEMKLEKKRQTQLLSSLHAEIELVRSRIRRRNQTRDDQHRTIEENGATYTRQHSPASK